MFKTVFGSARIWFHAVTLITAVALSSPLSAATEATAADSYGKLPLVFEANRGQTDERVKFLSRGRGYSLFLTDDQAVLSLSGAADTRQTLRMKLVGAEAKPKITGIGRLPGVSNYFIGRDRAKWRTGVPHYARVGYESVYPGIDLVFYGTGQRRLEYDFVVAPGADPDAIALSFDGAERLEINEDGDLVATLSGGEVRFLKPVIYQKDGAEKLTVAGGYVLTGNRVGFDIAAYDPAKPLIIDPVLEYPGLAYSTFLGGNDEDRAFGIAVDAAGSAYVTGTTRSSNFPVTDLTEYSGMRDLFVAKLYPDGSGLEYATIFGGETTDNVSDIAVDGAGNAYVTGSTPSNDLPLVSAFRESGSGSDAFVAKLNPAGELVYSTYLGHKGGAGIAVKPGCSTGGLVCHIYVTGDARNSAAPLTPEAFQISPAGAFLVVLDPELGPDGLVYGTYLGGSGGDEGFAIAVGGNGDAYLTGETFSNDFPTTPYALDTNCGHDAVDDDCTGEGGGSANTFVTVLRPGNQGESDLIYSSYLGGALRSYGRDIAVMPGCESQCLAFVTGHTTSVDFPTTPTAILDGHLGGRVDSDIFLTVINTASDVDPSNDLVYSTLFGGEDGMAIAADDLGRAYIAGHAAAHSAGEVPIRDAIDPDVSRLFVAVIDTTESGPDSLLFSTYLGSGSTWRIATGDGAAYVIGSTGSEDFPTTAGAFQEELAFTEPSCKACKSPKFNPVPQPTQDAFVTKIAGPFAATGDITPVAVPSRPVAADDSDYPALENTPLTVSAGDGGVLDNDIDPEGDALTTILIRNALNGTVVLDPDGGFTYTSNTGFAGVDHFAYAAFDGQAESNVAIAEINVADVNVPPVAVNDNYSVAENAALTVATPGVLANDSDGDGNSLTATIVSQPAFGSLNIATGESFDGGFTYTPNENRIGPDGFTYKANDGLLDSNTATVSLFVTGGTMHIGDLDSEAVPRRDLGRVWSAAVTITVHDENEDPVPDATVGVFFDMNKSGTSAGTCTTNLLGQCSSTVIVQNKTQSVIFTATSVAHELVTYVPLDNHDADGDSDGTSMTVFKP